MKNLRERAEEFRASIIDLVKAEVLPSLATFPRGCCNDSAYLLGTYLNQKGFGEFEAVEADSSIEGNNTTHSWLEKNGLIIDITGSQFGKNMQDVYIGRSPEWLSNWVVDKRRNAQIFNDRLILGNAYNEIVTNIK